MKRRYRILFGLAALVIVLDQLSKWWVMAGHSRAPARGGDSRFF